MPVRLMSAFQNFDMKILSRLLTILIGRPFLQYQLSKNIWVNFSAVRDVCDGMILMSVPSRSVMVMMESKPLSGGRGPKKSMATLLKWLLGTGRGCRGPAGLCVLLLF